MCVQGWREILSWRMLGTAVLGVKVWMRSPLPEGTCVFSVCLLPRGGMAQPPFTAPPGPPQDMIPQDMILLGQGRGQILPSTNPCCLELALSYVGTQATLNSPFFLSVTREAGRRPAGWFPHWETGRGLGNPLSWVKEPDLGLSLGILCNAEMARERELCGEGCLPSGHRRVGH